MRVANSASLPCWCLICACAGPGLLRVQCALELLGCQRASRTGDYNALCEHDLMCLGVLRENLQEAKDLLPQPVVSWQVGRHARLRQGPRELSSRNAKSLDLRQFEVGILEDRSKTHETFVSLVLGLELEEPYGTVRDHRRDPGPILMMILLPELADLLGPDTSSFCTSGRYAAKLGVEVARGREQPADLPRVLRPGYFEYPVSVKCRAVQLAIRLKNPEECIAGCSYAVAENSL